MAGLEITRIQQAALDWTRQIAEEQIRRELSMNRQQVTEQDQGQRTFNENFGERFGLDSNLVGGLLRFKIESANVAETSVQNPGSAQIRQIAQENAPLLVLPKRGSVLDQIFEQTFLPNVLQSNLPANPQEYINNSRLREDVPVGFEAPDFNPFNGGFDPTPLQSKDKQIGDNTNGNSGDNFTPTDVGKVTNERYFLDLNNDMRNELGSTDAPLFYQFEPAKDGEPPKLTYHIFYAYNDAPKAGSIDFNHEGDWERVTYELDPQTFQPVKAILSAHEGGSTLNFKDFQRDPTTNRPFVFVANGSHANYATPGNHKIEVAGIPVTFDQTSNIDDAMIFDPAANLAEITSQSWYPNSGNGLRWGEIGESNHSSGPQGPSINKGSVDD